MSENDAFAMEVIETVDQSGLYKDRKGNRKNWFAKMLEISVCDLSSANRYWYFFVFLYSWILLLQVIVHSGFLRKHEVILSQHCGQRAKIYLSPEMLLLTMFYLEMKESA